MKTSNKSSFITGIVLLALAAFFTICLLLQLLNFGASGPGHNDFLFILGLMLTTVYGYSSIFIPVFLFISGISCFASKWTARRTLRLLTALVPFFTCVIIENICRSIYELKNHFSILEIIVTLIIGLMLLIIEFLGVGIIADKIQNGSFKQMFKAKKIKTSKLKLPESDETENEDTSEYEEISEQSDESSTNEQSNTSAKDSIFENINDTIAETSEKLANGEQNSSEKKTSEPSIFDEALLKVEQKDKQNSANNEENIYENPLESVQNQKTEQTPVEASDKSSENTAAEENASNEEKTENDNSSTNNPSSMITQEEFAALTTPVYDEDFDSPSTENTFEETESSDDDDELVWNNLPPKPAVLPPDYDEDYVDENDPDLEFPPKDEEESEDEIEEEVFSNEQTFSQEDDDSTNDDSTNEDSFGVETPEFDDENQETDDSIENFYPDEDDEDEIYDDTSLAFSEELNEPDEQESLQENSSPALPKFSDAIKENPAFSHGIRIHDDDEEPVEEEKKSPETVKSPFPSKITLSNDDDENAPENSENEQENEDDVEVSDEVYYANSEPSSSNSDEFINETFAIEDEETEEPQLKSPVVEQNSSPVKNSIFPSAGSSVFSDMEAEIRSKQAEKHPENSQKTSPKTEVTFSGIREIPNQATPSLDSPSPTANNLTADALTDFFNAQQAENTPKTQTIAANPPRVGNRATKKGPYIIPSDLLTAYKDDQYWIIDDATKKASMNLKQTLAEFNIEAQIIGIKKGPVVTMFEILPAPGVKLSKIVALQDNIALSLAAQSVRIVAPIPGKQAVGIEVPNKHRSVVGFREIIEMDLPEWNKMAVPVVLGKDILGKAQLIDLAKTPHMLIAGATGSGKSVCVNSLILSILYKRSFRDVKMILVDPKVVELKLYNNIPHLLTPVITEPKKAIQALQWCLCEMERRYALLDSMGVRDISNYNIKIKQQEICTERLPYIVVIIDEFADLMATSGKELESIVARLTAMSRAVGIHLVLATQRPSVNVITGLIKANIPTRIAFMVASRTDSNIIIDTVGAEKLLGRGDMLYASATDPAPIRIQGTFVNDNEVEDVVSAVKEYGEPDYIDDEMFVEDDEDSARDLFGEPMSDDDPLYDQALKIVVEEGKASASYLQRRLKIGYNRAARLVEEMEDRGIVGPANGSKPREIIHIP